MKIEDELRSILNSKGDQGDELNQLVDEFRGGRSPSEVLHLLHSDDEEFVKTGAYIANEISFDWYNTPEFISRLHELSHHEVPTIRALAFGALFPSLDKTDPRSLELVDRHRHDENKGVRMGAEAAASRLGL